VRTGFIEGIDEFIKFFFGIKIYPFFPATDGNTGDPAWILQKVRTAENVLRKPEGHLTALWRLFMTG
jgi:hypothetical protein